MVSERFVIQMCPQVAQPRSAAAVLTQQYRECSVRVHTGLYSEGVLLLADGSPQDTDDRVVACVADTWSRRVAQFVGFDEPPALRESVCEVGADTAGAASMFGAVAPPAAPNTRGSKRIYGWVGCFFLTLAPSVLSLSRG